MKASSRKAIFEIYPARGGRFKWHVKRGGRIIAESREPYLRRRGAERAISNLSIAIANAEFRVDNIGAKEKKK